MDDQLGAGDASNNSTTGRENGEVSIENDSLTDTRETTYYYVQRSTRRKRKRRELTNFSLSRN